MQKKLLAVAVAGALAVPVIAAAQSSVQVSGRVTYEYGRGDAGNGREDTDYADTPGGSNVRFSGRETLGGGMTAWFQCETSADIRGFDQIGLCSRNSAVGLRGGFGNIFFGRWDTPFKRVINHGTVGAEETGLLGTSFLAFGGSGGASASSPGVAAEGQNRQRWKRRETCLTTYETPKFGGFQVLGGFTCGNTPFDNALVSGQPNSKPRVWSLGAQYQAGALEVGIGYERHNEFGSTVPGSPELDDKGWGIGASYGFMNGNILLGASYLRREWETGTIGGIAGTETKKDTWSIGLDWRLPGPHQIQLQYQVARDTKGNGGSIAAGANGGITGCNVGGIINCSDTGADQFSIAYQYHLSKRTTFKLGYVKIDNDSRTNTTRIGNTPVLLTNGENVDSYAFLIKHNF